MYVRVVEDVPWFPPPRFAAERTLVATTFASVVRSRRWARAEEVTRRSWRLRLRLQQQRTSSSSPFGRRVCLFTRRPRATGE